MRPHCHCTWTVQSYSQVAPMCTPCKTCFFFMLTQVHIPNEPPLLPSKLPLHVRDLDTHVNRGYMCNLLHAINCTCNHRLIHASLGDSCPQPKWYLDRFSHFCRAHDCDRPTDRPHYSIRNNRLHLCHAVMRHNNKYQPTEYLDVF